MTIWDDVATERQELADDLETLTDDQWAQSSLCEAWTIKATAAHLTTIFHTSMPKFMIKTVMSGGAG
jgi:uncharacterized damage-inducible protein DinB